jgi:hypothetical protein
MHLLVFYEDMCCTICLRKYHETNRTIKIYRTVCTVLKGSYVLHNTTREDY